MSSGAYDPMVDPHCGDGTCVPGAVAALWACIDVDWSRRAAGPEQWAIKTLVEHEPRSWLRKEVESHRVFARKFATVQKLEVDLDGPWSAIAAAVITALLDPQRGRLKLMGNRIQSNNNRQFNKKSAAISAEIIAENALLSAASHEMQCRAKRAHWVQAYATYRRLDGHIVDDRPPCVGGIGGADLFILPRSAMAGSDPRMITCGAPPGGVWVACEDGLAVALCAGDTSALHFFSVDVLGRKLVQLVRTDTVGGVALPPIASAAVMGGFLFMSHEDAVTRCPFGPRLCGNRQIKRAAMQLPGTWTVLSAHGGTTLVCASTNGVVMWPECCADGTRRVIVASFDEDAPVVRRPVGASGLDGTRRHGIRAACDYLTPPLRRDRALVVRDGLPQWASPSSPVQAVMCTNSNNLLVQINSTVSSLHVAFVGSGGKYDDDWTVREWGEVNGLMLCAFRRPDGTVCVCTTAGVHVGPDVFVGMSVCASASMVDYTRVLRDGEVTPIEVPIGEPAHKRTRTGAP